MKRKRGEGRGNSPDACMSADPVAAVTFEVQSTILKQLESTLPSKRSLLSLYTATRLSSPGLLLCLSVYTHPITASFLVLFSKRCSSSIWNRQGNAGLQRCSCCARTLSRRAFSAGTPSLLVLYALSCKVRARNELNVINNSNQAHLHKCTASRVNRCGSLGAAPRPFACSPLVRLRGEPSPSQRWNGLQERLRKG